MTEPPPSRELYRRSSAVLSAAMALVGVAILVRTIAGGGGPLALGVLLGLLFLAAGAGRLWFATRGHRR